MTMEPGRLWKPDMGRADEGVLVGGGGSGGCWANELLDI